MLALIGHPANDLTPETVMIFVFHAFSPAPCAVGTHEEDFADAVGASHEEREAAEFVRDVFVDAEDFGAGFGEPPVRTTGSRGDLPRLQRFRLASRQVW